MITKYIAKALARAVYEPIEKGAFGATVRGLRGVLATGFSVEQCRQNLAEVVEEWLLVRVAQHLPIPRLGGVTVRIRRAS
jgi:predicted RNase H-like HicB family nuclease